MISFKLPRREAPAAIPAPALQLPRTVALGIVAALVTAGVAVSFAESYRALYWWAKGHAVHGIWAVAWPIQIDAFVAVGELSLFVALLDGWKPRHRSLPWIITAGGLVVSVAGNVGHVVTVDVFTRLTAAVPSLTAYVMLAAGLGLLKRVVAYQPQPAARKRPGPKPGTVRKPRAVQDPEDALKAQAFATLPASGQAELEFRPPIAAVAPLGWDPDATSSFPKLGADGHPVVKAA